MLATLTLPGGAALPLYPVLLALAALFGLLVGPAWAAALGGLDRRAVARTLWTLAPVVFIGGRIHFVINQWQWFEAKPWKALELWAGLHAGGAIIALAVATPVIARFYGLPIGRLADALTPTIGVGVAIARLGCFMNGCCFGTVCHLPWCISFPAHAAAHRHHVGLELIAVDAVRSLPIHPLQLYFSVCGLLVTAASLRLLRRRHADGQVALVGLLIFSASTMLLEPLRADQLARVYWGPLPQLLWTAIAMTTATIALLLLSRRRRPAPVATPTNGGPIATERRDPRLETVG